MEVVLDYDPLSGNRCVMKTEGDKLLIRNEQDPTGFLEQARILRNSDDYTRKGIKEDHWHYARIPDGVAQEMLEKHGVNMITPPFDWKAIFACINAHYPWLKTTNKTHA